MNIDVIKSGSIIDIQVSESFYKRIQALAIYLSNVVDPKELATQIDLMKQDGKLSEFGFSFETIIILLQEIEDKAKAQDLLQSEELPVPSLPNL